MAKSYYDKYMDDLHKEYNITRQLPKPMYSAYQDVEQNHEGKRTALSRVFDVLNVGQYAVAGFAQGIVDPLLNPMEGFVGGLKAANPLGKGNKDGQYSFSGVLETAGWKPETTGGKILRGAVGFAGDVFLDPVNYLSGGLKGIVQGTGKHAMKVALGGAELLDTLGDSAKFIDNVSDLKKSVGMTQEVAEAIIKNSKIFKTGNVPIDLATDATELVKKFNKVIGITAEGSADIVWSLSNVPFGNKIFGKAAEKEFVVMSGEGLKLLGDATVAPAYAQLRNKIFGGQLGKLFSTSHDLYKISQSEPELVYDFLKWSDTVRGLGSDKIASKKAIYNEAKRLMDMSPSQADEMIKLMEDKTVWGKVQQTFKFFDTKEAEVFKANIEAKKAETVSKLDELESFYKNIGEEKEIVEEALSSAKLSKQQTLDKLNMEKASKLLDVEAEYITRIDDAKRYINQLDDVSNKFEFKSFDVEIDDVEYLKLRFEQYKSRGDIIDNVTSVVDGKPLGGSVKEISKPDNMPNSTFYRLRKDLELNGYKEYASTKHADNALSKLGEGWEKVSLDNGRVRVFPPNSMPKDGVVKETVEQLTDRVTKTQVIEDLSTYLFGNKGFIDSSTYDDNVKKIIDYATTHTKEETIQYMLTKSELYNGKVSTMYSFIGEEIGYGKNSKYKTWDEHYTKRVNDLMNKLDKTGSLSPEEQITLTKLKQDNVKRNALRNQFKNANTKRDVDTIVGSIKESKNQDIIDAYIKDVEKVRLQLSGEYGLEDAGDGVKKAHHKPDKVSTDFALNKAQREDMMYKYSKARYESIDPTKTKPTTQEQVGLLDKLNKSKGELANTKLEIETVKNELKAFDMIIESPVGGRGLMYDELKNKQYAEHRLKELTEKIGHMSKSVREQQSNYINVVRDPSLIKVNPSEIKRMDRIMDEMEYIMEHIYKKGYNELSDNQIDVAFRWATNRDIARGLGKPVDKLGSDIYSEVQQEVTKRSLKASMAEAKKASSIRANTEILTWHEGEQVNAIVKSITKDGDGKKAYEVVVNGVTKTVGERNVIKVLGEAKPTDIDSLRHNIHMLDDFLLRQEDTVFNMTKKVEELKAIPKEIPRSEELFVNMDYSIGDTKIGMYKEGLIPTIESDKAKKIEAIMNMSNDTLDTLETVIQELETNKVRLDTMFGMGTSSFIDDYTRDIKKFDKLLSDANAFDTYILNNTEFGTISKMDYDKIIEKYNPDMGKYILDESLEIDDVVRNNVMWLRDELIKIGTDEVSIDKLKVGQLDANMYDYLPHILTDEGKELFASGDIKRTLPGFGDVDGFGREFNPYSQKRTIRNIPDGAGGWIDKPTIREINELFSDVTNGKGIFTEDLHEIYLTRAIKHNELMYDNKYMENMLELFGESYDGTKLANHTVSMNYGKLKDYSLQVSNTHASLDMSDSISEYLAGEDVQKKIHDLSHEIYSKNQAKPFKKVHSEVMSDVIQEYIDTTFTKEYKSKLYSERFQSFLDGTNTGGLLDDVGMPMTMLDDKQVDLLKKEEFKLKERFELNIKKKFNGFMNLGGEYEPVSGRMIDQISRKVQDMSISDIADELKSILPEADEVDYARIESLLGKIEKYDAIKEPQIRQVQNAIVNKANQSRKISIMKDQSEFLQVYDKFTHFIKVNQTAVLPGFHGRNKTSNMFNNWLVIGQDAVDVKFQKEVAHAMQVASGKPGLTDTMLTIVKDGVESEIPWSNIIKAAEDFGVIDSGVFAQEIGVTGASKGVFKGIGVPGKFDPTNMKEFIPYKVGTKIGTNIENHDKIIHFASQIKNGMDFKDAAESATKALFDYGDLTMFEQSVMKRIFPYYTWLRKNSQFQLEMMLESPDKFRMVGKVIGGVAGMVNDEDKINMAFVNEFAMDWIQTPFSVTNEKGKKEPVLWNPNLPFMDVGRIPDPFHPIDSAKGLFTQMNPLFKVPIELAANKNVFFESPIAKKDENRLTKSLEYVASQMGAYPVAKGVVQKSDSDLALHVLNHTTGIKFLSYDYDTYKPMKILEILDEKYVNERLKRKASKFGNSIVSGFENQMSLAKSAINTDIDVIADIAYNGRPIRPDEYTDALRPISEETFKSLPADERSMYTPPTENDAMRYHQKAVEAEQAVMEQTGVMKRFTWALLEDAKQGSRNKPYMFGNVTNVKDGDTFDMNIGGKKETVRLLLVDAPETEKLNKEGMPFGDEATEFAKKALIDKDVMIFLDGTERDKYGRILAYVEVGGEDFNQQLLESGMAQTGYVIDPPYQRLGSYQQAEKRAHSSGSGIWGMSGYASPDSNASYSQQYSLGDYDDYKRKKFSQMMNIKQDFKINPNPMDNILKKLR